jgi:NifU-like protein involved in Fe-S cluster formation
MINEIYNRKILEFAANIPHLQRLEHPDATAFGQDVKACALGQASSSIMGAHVIGSSAPELRALRETMYKMLKENGEPPHGKWSELEALIPVRDYKARHASTLLTFDAVVDAINQIEAKHASIDQSY